MPFETTAKRTPLWMLTREPPLHDLIEYLEAEKKRILSDPEGRHQLTFSGRQIEEARIAFGRMILQGEEHLHRLCDLLCRNLFVEGRYRLRSVVVGQAQGSSERFTLMQPLSEPELYSNTDLDLGSRVLQRLRFDVEGDWQRADLVANFVEYEPIARNRYSIYKVVSRVKAEEEIWNKVADEIFDIDTIVAQDKELRQLSRFVKDVLGVKFVVGSEQDARKLQVVLESQAWLASDGASLGSADSAPDLNFFEVKDYLGTRRGKDSGWRAIKSVARWGQHLFEIQIQPLRNYHAELERFTAESHAGFKARREALRHTVEQQLPLFGFYRALLKWLFLEPETPPPAFQSVEVTLSE